MTWLSFIQGWFWLEIEITGNQWINNWNHRHFLLSKRSTWLVLTVSCNFWRKERKKIDEIGWITGKKSSLFIKLFFYIKSRLKTKIFFFNTWIENMEFQQVDEKQEQNDTKMLSMPLFWIWSKWLMMVW